MTADGRPVAVAIQDDFEVIVEGLAVMLAPHADLVSVVDVETAPDVTDARAEVAAPQDLRVPPQVAARTRARLRAGQDRPG